MLKYNVVFVGVETTGLCSNSVSIFGYCATLSFMLNSQSFESRFPQPSPNSTNGLGKTSMFTLLFPVEWILGTTRRRVIMDKDHKGLNYQRARNLTHKAMIYPTKHGWPHISAEPSNHNLQ